MKRTDMNKEMGGPATIERPGWTSLLLICKDCRRRKNGPKHLKATTLAKDIKHQVKEIMPGTRIILTTCLKLCPKKATSVAYISAAAEQSITAIGNSDQLLRRLPLLIGRS
jgi:predicted metal-binding protein